MIVLVSNQPVETLRCHKSDKFENYRTFLPSSWYDMHDVPFELCVTHGLLPCNFKMCHIS